MKNYFKITTLSFFERISFAVGRTLFTIGIIYFYGYEINGQFSAFWSLVVIVSTFFLFGLDTILITYAKNENENFGYLGKERFKQNYIFSINYWCVNKWFNFFFNICNI